jgi:hypothetical protein
MGPVPANPLWQNFFSILREAITAQEVGTGMEKSHHLTASLYFGIASSRSFEARREAERERKLRLVG